ncbi:hypothetical membrane protein [Pelotomaculum thermopropionicum SI]|uniref:Hypothetical membrane protein n=1 Tax=Pelotomaculum thermopropionicum (strain DSM 13744 / JCM 10971 / SI) TaxID=370438 RepID=A5CYY8_PELTS|nr:hypothetical membrane protein [Pelotomaculum thermopropionicum SI]
MIKGKMRHPAAGRSLADHRQKLFRRHGRPPGYTPVENFYLGPLSPFVSLHNNKINPAYHCQHFLRRRITFKLPDHLYPAGRGQSNNVGAGPGKAPGVLARLIELYLLVGVLDHANPVAAALQFADQFFQKGGFAGTGIAGQADDRDALFHLSLRLRDYFDGISGLNLPAGQNADENALPGHDAVPCLVVNGASGMAFLSNLGDLAYRLAADFQAGAQGQAGQVDSLGGEVLGKIPGPYIQPHCPHFFYAFHS